MLQEIKFTQVIEFWSSYLDQELVKGNFSNISISEIWNDATNDKGYFNILNGYIYKIYFFGTIPVGCESIYYNAIEEFKFKNRGGIISRYKYIKVE